MKRKELYKEFKKISESNDSIKDKASKCVDLYNKSSEWNKTYCHSQIYKILGYIPDEIIDCQHLLDEFGELNDYANLKNYLELKEKEKGKK